MVHYETLFLASTEITEEEVTLVEKQLEQLLSSADGKLSQFDKWGKYRLAYPVKKSAHGIYILARYSVPTEQAEKVLSEFDRFLKIKCHETVLRYVNIKLSPKAASTAYIKPEPIDIARGGSFDSFIKGNNIENLLNSVESNNSQDVDSDNHLDGEA